MKKTIFLCQCIFIILFISFNSVYAESPLIKTLNLEEDWRITSDYDINVPANTVLIINGNDSYYIYEMGGRLINTGEGSVVFENTILYPLADDNDTKKVCILNKWDADEASRLLLERNGISSSETLNLFSGGNLSYTFNITNSQTGYSYDFSAKSTTEIAGTFIIALYDNSCNLVGISTSIMLPDTSHMITSSEIKTTAAATSYKIIFWDKLDSMTPMCKALKGNILNKTEE